MKTLLRFLCLVLGTAALAGPVSRLAYESQVVTLLVTTQSPNAWRPWENKTPETRAVQAVVVDGPLLATTADLLQGATMILVEKHGSPLREPARIVHVDAEANLALLTVEKAGFFDDLRPAALAPSIPTEGQVSTVRWRSGQLEISASRITRIEVRASHLGALEHAFLLVETDLVGGGWADPVFQDGFLVGITYSQDGRSATVVPADILRAYLESARSAGSYREFANFELLWQVNRDPALTAYLGLEGEPRGVLVTQVPWGSSACGTLFPRDILLSLDGHAIDAVGNYEDAKYGRLRFNQIVADGHRAGDVIPAEVLRDGKKVAVRLTLRPARADLDLAPFRAGAAPPGYVIAGGLLFRELDRDYLRAWGKDWQKKAPSLLMTWYNFFRTSQTPSRRRIVILADVLPASYNLGYGDLEDIPVVRINGRDIGSIADVDEAFRHPEKGFHRIVLTPNDARSEIVLDAATLDAATREVLQAYQIPERSRLPRDPLPEIGDACPARP